jgi:hypothetical protein
MKFYRHFVRNHVSTELYVQYLQYPVLTIDKRVSKADGATGEFLNISQWHFLAHASGGINFRQSHVTWRRHIWKYADEYMSKLCNE